MTENLLHLHALSAGYFQNRKAPIVVVQPFTATLPDGKLICLIGPNGAGKSTLLRTIAGMQNPLSGRVDLRGRDIHRMTALERARQLSVVLTQRSEVGMFTGYALVAMGRHPYTSWTGQLSAGDHATIRQALELVGGEHLATRSLSTMSDGERQRVMIARALAQEPDLLVLDEPTAFLDLPRRVECMVLLRSLARRTGRTVLLSTHDLDLALRTADQMWLIDDQGRVTIGLPEDLVLKGAFEAAFASANVEFDLASGAFKTGSDGVEQVALHGEGVAYIWTRRALEREGYTVVADALDGLPLVRTMSGGEQHWQLIVGASTVDCHSVDALIGALRQPTFAV